MHPENILMVQNFKNVLRFMVLITHPVAKDKVDKVTKL